MNTVKTFFALILVSVTMAWAQPELSIRQLQQVPYDSLLVADALQNSVPSRWTLQTSPYSGSTVTVTAVCVVPAKVLTFTAAGFTMLLQDTGTVNSWGYIFVRVNSPTDSAQIILDGFLNVERGDIIRITGIVSEFPLTNMNSLTQFQPIAGNAIQILGSSPVPEFKEMSLSDFYQGVFPGGTVSYSGGEAFEGCLVQFTNLTVDARVNTARGTFSVVDDEGNQITMYDASRFFTLGHGGTTPFGADTQWTRIYPVVGSRIDTLRGFITTVSGSESPRGYRIAPIYYGDVKIGVILPSVTTHRRNPIVVHPDSVPRITCRAVRQSGGYPIASVNLNYSLNNGPFVSAPMTFNPIDSTYGATISNQPENTFVHYFIQAVDTAGNRANLASSAFGGASSDTSKGFFFYTSLSRTLTINDIQYTPYLNGRTSYLGAQVTVSGVVTADTANIGISPLNTGGTNAWYMQSGTSPWNGLWIVGAESTLAGTRNGDSITVTGFVDEQFDVTRLSSVSYPVTIHSTGNPEPAPMILPTSTFGPIIGNGNPIAEQWEGMLVRLNNVRVSSIDPVFSDPTEFEVDDGSGPVLVRRDGTHSYSNVAADTAFGKTLIRLNDQISSLTGVIYYSFNRYKIVPRRNADFGTITSVEVTHDPAVPQSFSLAQNYPNPFNPTTVIVYQLPSKNDVSLKLYNILGQQVRELVNDVQEAGQYTVRFDAGGLSTGVYFYQLHAGKFTQVKKMILVK